MDQLDLVVALVGGTALGVLAKAVFPGRRDRIPLWLTVICGVAGVVAGSYAHTLLFGTLTGPWDWFRHAWQAAGAVVLVVAAARVTARPPEAASARTARPSLSRFSRRGR